MVANPIVRQLTQSLMQQRPQAAHGLAGGIAAAGQPIANALMARSMMSRERAQDQAEVSGLGRLLQEAAKAKQAGGDPLQAATAFAEANKDQPGIAAGMNRFMQMNQQHLAKSLFGQEQPKETFTEVRDPAGNIIGQRSSSGKVVTDPRASNLLSPEEMAQKIKLKMAGRDQTTINMPKKITEIDAMVEQIDKNREKFKQTGNPRYNRVADALEMKLKFGGKPPEAYSKARQSLGLAREGVAMTYNLLKKGTSAIKPTDRAKLSQAINQLKLAFADLLNRGANFTETEEAMVGGVIGGDPTDILQRMLQGDQAFLDRLKKTGEIIENRGQALIQTYTSPEIGKFTYPWEKKGGEGGAPEASTAAPQTTSSGLQFRVLP